jgi:hypothetical protein
VVVFFVKAFVKLMLTHTGWQFLRVEVELIVLPRIAHAAVRMYTKLHTKKELVMKFVKGLRTIIMLAIFFFAWFSNSVNAKILWSKDLSDANTNSVPLASCLNKDSNGIIVMTRECPKGDFPYPGGDLALWEIGIDGNIARTTPKDTNGNRIWIDSYSIGRRIASDKLGNLFIVGMLSKPGERQKIAVISKADKAERIMSTSGSIDNYSIIKMIPSRDNAFVLVGKRDSVGSCLRIDSQGRTSQEKLLNKDKMNIFSGIDQIKSDDSNLALAGVSFGMMSRNPNENLSENSIFLCDSNLKTIYEDHFTGGRSYFLLSPKVCCLNNGNIVVLYEKENADPNKTLLWTRCYTKELKLLWDKEVFVADKPTFAMDITARGSGGFTVGVIQYIVQQSNSLEFDSFDNEGSKIEQINHKGIFGIEGFNLMHLNNKVIVVVEELTPVNSKDASMKAKVIALD